MKTLPLRRSTTLLLSLALALPALAQPGPPGPPDGFDGPPPTRKARERIRTMRAIALANALDLDERAALKRSAIMRRFDDQRDEVHASLEKHFAILEKASAGEKVAAKVIDGAIAAVLAAHERMAALRREEFQALAADLPPVKRARLAVFLRDFPKHVRKIMRMGRGERGPGRRGGGRGARGFEPTLEPGE